MTSDTLTCQLHVQIHVQIYQNDFGHTHMPVSLLPFLIDIKCGHVSKQDGIHNKTK